MMANVMSRFSLLMKYKSGSKERPAFVRCSSRLLRLEILTFKIPRVFSDRVAYINLGAAIDRPGAIDLNVNSIHEYHNDELNPVGPVTLNRPTIYPDGVHVRGSLAGSKCLECR